MAKQNARRAALKAAEKERALEAACYTKPKPATKTKRAASRVDSDVVEVSGGRLLGAVAAFWERKKAKSNTGLPS